MSIAILSDLHFGDGSSRLVDANNTFSTSGAYQKLKEGIFNFTNKEPITCLVLAGDILDFSINSIDSSIKIGQPFFRQISSDKLARKVIYIPGNHDKQVWDGLQWDISIIGNLSAGRPPKPFVRIQAGTIDLTNTSRVELKGVKPNEEGNYGDIFLKGLFDLNATNPEIILAYPNLYIKTSNETILVTHGHMLETAWVLLSELLRGSAYIPNDMGLKELEEWNVPLTSLICTGVGSAGKVSELFYKIEREAYEKKNDVFLKTMDTVLPRLKDILECKWYMRILPNSLIKKILGPLVTKAEDPRKYEKYFDNDEQVKKFKVFFNATKKELSSLGLAEPKKIIFGHTHHPYGRNNPYKTPKLPGLEFYNTGGWLKESKAEIFLLDESRFESFSI